MMELRIVERDNQKIAEMVSEQIEIKTVQDALDLMVNADYKDARNIILYEENVCPDFFDLKSRLAGEILQKFVTYRMKLAIVGDFARYHSKSLSAFMLECNRGRHIFFLKDRETAMQKMTT